MSKAPQKLSPDDISLLFAQLSPQDVAEFHNGYQQWLRQHRIANLQTHIERVRLQIAENNRQMQQTHPSPIALASLARLQSNGVTDLDLLDRMLERGEAWLDNTMQHLDYCENFDFIRGNYTEWCEHALEGAYDWIDSMHKVSLEAAKSSPQPAALSPTQSSTLDSASNGSDERLHEATEETFLQKLMSEEDVSLLDTKLEIASASPITSNHVPLADQDTALMQATGPHAKQPTAEIPTEDVEAQFITPTPTEGVGARVTAPLPVEDREARVTAPLPVEDEEAQFIAPQPHAELENANPTEAISPSTDSTARDQTPTSMQPSTKPALAVDTHLERPEAVDPTPVFVDETPAQTAAPESIITAAHTPNAEISDIATEGTAASMLVSTQEAPTSTPEETVDSLPLPADDTPSTHSATEQTAPSEQIAFEDQATIVLPPSVQPYTIAASNTSETPLPAPIESTTTPIDTSPDEVATTTSAPALEAISDEVTTDADAHPSIPAQTHSQKVSDTPTLPKIPTTATPQPPEETIEPDTAASGEPSSTTKDTPWRWEDPLPSETNTPSNQPTTLKTAQQPDQPPSSAAQPPKKRNFLQRLFGIFSGNSKRPT
jgi:hypothetical protein